MKNISFVQVWLMQKAFEKLKTKELVNLKLKIEKILNQRVGTKEM